MGGCALRALPFSAASSCSDRATSRRAEHDLCRSSTKQRHPFRQKRDIELRARV
jgi:hypothetical protein